ncbi:RNase adapter RapZ [Candidatus Hepatobacter penaei]|uniref:RNase adapter RapZ n=1 Tax=Candidatus Hepatobacter penaei TaxID=1274402 RepID=UPI0004F388C2|nr:RNase adapter RapZ [Candidatus Hepatobacter penaei]
MPNQKKKKPARVVFLAGLAGAGRSLMLKTLEDLGYETIDNLPLFLAESVIFGDETAQAPFALSIDLRSRYFSVPAVFDLLANLKKKGVAYRFVFLESDDSVIERRYRETRRHHPLSTGKSLSQAIEAERALLAPLKDVADHVLDTSLLNPIELKGLVRNIFGFAKQRPVVFEIMSFSFVGGIPREANLVFDMRFLKNPHYDPNLQSLTGRDQGVQDFLFTLPLFESFGQHLKAMLSLMLPSVVEEGRGMFVIAFGCSGGRHRSVAMAESLYKWLLAQEFYSHIQHRELDS